MLWWQILAFKAQSADLLCNESLRAIVIILKHITFVISGRSMYSHCLVAQPWRRITFDNIDVGIVSFLLYIC